jgi:hypothetical protein
MAFQLLASTGVADIDTILGDIVRQFEKQLPNCIVGYYLIGSYADGSAVSLSDIDLYVVLRDSISESQESTAYELSRQQAEKNLIRLDFVLRRQAALSTDQSLLRVAFKTRSLLLYGADIRDTIPLPAIELYTRDATEGARLFFGRILRNQEPVIYPLEYPVPNSEFRGYEWKRIPPWYPPGTQFGTKEFVNTMLRMATARLTMEAGLMPGSKSESLRLYREQIHDEWTEFLGAVYDLCKRRWHYTLPAGADERAELRRLCTSAIDYENSYLQSYRRYLLASLTSPEIDQQRFAIGCLGKVIFPDDEVLDALNAVHPAPEIEKLLHHTLQAVGLVISADG